MNRVILVGNVTRDVELQTSSGGLSFCHFTLAVPRAFKNEKDEKQSDFIKVTVWRTLAENVAKFVHQGDKVAVVGKIQGNSYEKDGEKKYSTDIVADEVEFLVTKKKEAVEDKKELKEIEDDGIPF